MDDATLSAQFAKTGNIMDLCNTPEWLQEIQENEFDDAGSVGAGLTSRSYIKAVNSLTSDQLKAIKRSARLQSILFVELKAWMETWELGAGFEDVYIVTRSIIREHLKSLTPDQKEWVEKVLIEDKELERDAKKPFREKTRTILLDMFTDKDWQTMADKAAQSAKSNILNVSEVGLVETVVAEVA